MVFLYSTTEFSGQLINETDEGKVFWQDINQLANLNLASSFLEMADMMFHQLTQNLFMRLMESIGKRNFIDFA